MIYITQLIYVHPGQEATFQEFEAYVLPLLGKHNGQMKVRLRPTSDTFIDGELDQPYEVHLIAFNSEGDFDAFMHDEERARFLHLKNSAVRKVLFIRGQEF